MSSLGAVGSADYGEVDPAAAGAPEGSALVLGDSVQDTLRIVADLTLSRTPSDAIKAMKLLCRFV